MTNPYAPPQATVRDIADPTAVTVPAERGTRLGASILDGVISAIMIGIPFMLAVLLIGATNRTVGGDGDFGLGRSPAVIAVAAIVSLIGIVAWSWITYVNVKRNGQTIGKKMLNIKVVRSNGAPASVGRIFWLRNVVNGLLGMIPLYGLVDHLFIFAESRQCLHDKLADTIVVKA